MNNLRKLRLVLLIVGLGTALVAPPASATVYNDATGDLHDGSGGGADFTGFTHLDIASVEITNDLSNINFAITLAGDILATDWGKYMIIIDSIDGGDPAGNGWGRPISMPAGADSWLGSWVDSGNGAETYSWDGAVWNLDNATWNPPADVSITTSQFTATITTTLDALGLSPGDSLIFDVFSSGGGGGDSAVDALSLGTPSILDWGDQFDSFSELKYDVIPEPASLALLAIGALALIRRGS